MPVARIYASLVEEAEPICADLLARGYNVEVVFPDAVLPTPADLELRVERCSAEQAIARVEAGGSPSRCVFMTPGKGPRRELLLVEMTVLATGTDGRHPMAMPLPAQIAIAGEHLPQVPVEPGEARSAESGLASVLPFPAVPPAALLVGVSKMEPIRPLGDQNWNLSGNLIAELNAFLAHAPVMERPDGLHVRILENMRYSVSARRARKNWEGLTLAGVAASLLMLIALGWYATPKRPRQLATAAGTPVVRAAAPAVLPSVPSLRVAAESLKTVGLTMETSSAPRRQGFVRHRRLQPKIQDDLIAQDVVTNRVRRPAAKPWPTRSTQPTTTSELIRPPALRSAPIKIITDLK